MSFTEQEKYPGSQTASGTPLRDWTGDALRALPFVLGLLVATEQRASAYTDPGSGALIWQMVAAGFVGLMFYLRKFTSWFRRKKETKN